MNINPIILIFASDHLHIAAVAAPRHFFIFQGILDGALRFVQMQAIVEFTTVFKGEELGKIVSDFFLFHVYNTETFNPGSVDDTTSKTEIVHFCESRGMLPL